MAFIDLHEGILGEFAERACHDFGADEVGTFCVQQWTQRVRDWATQKRVQRSRMSECELALSRSDARQRMKSAYDRRKSNPAEHAAFLAKQRVYQKARRDAKARAA